MRLIRWVFAGIFFVGLALGCSRDEPTPAQELVTVEPARVAFNDDFVVRVAMHKREGLGVSIFKAGAAEGAPALTAQPLTGNEEVLTAEFGTVRLRPGHYFAAVTDDTGKRLAGAEFSVTEPTAKARIRVAKAPIYPGDPIEVTWRGSPGKQLDWIGIYKAGEPNLASYLGRVDTHAAADGTATFDGAAFGKALTPGKYEARLMRDGGYVEIANTQFLVTNPNAKPQVALEVTRVRSGEPLEVSWKDAPGNEKDYIGIYKADDPDLHHYLTYLYTDGAIDGRVTFKSTKQFGDGAPGQYVARLMVNDGYQELASTRFWVVDSSGKAQIAVAETRVKAGRPIEVLWTSAPAETPAWIGIYKTGDPDLQHTLARLDTKAVVDGRLTFKPEDFTGALEPGEYEVRLLRQDGTVELASTRFQVLDPNAGPQVTVAETVKSGDPIVVSWRSSPGNRQDWIGIYKAGASDTHQYIVWLYTDGAIDGSVTFSPQKLRALSPGEYQAMLLVNNGYDAIASATFTVTAP